MATPDSMSGWSARAFLLGGLVAASVASAQCSRRPPLPDVPAIPFQKYTLANGLDVILAEDHRLPLVAVDVWYHVGPANEVAGRTGFAHLFEHMMFQGSRHVPANGHFQYVESAGGTSANGTTDFDRTNYFETLPANELELGLWLESDRMGYLLDTLDERKFAGQQRVVREERSQNIENQPYGIVGDALFKLVYPKGHPYYANVMGSHADIQAAKLADVRAFFKQYYAPNNASLAIAGDFQSAAVRPLIEKYFGPLRRGPAVPKPAVTTPPITSERRAVVRDRVRLSRVYLAWLTPAFFAPGDADADAAAGVLGGGPSSRLFKALVYRKQIAQDVTAFQLSLGLASMFQVVATVRPGHTPEEVESALSAEIDAFRHAGPDEQELERAKNTFETSRLEELESLGGFGGVADTLNLFNQYVGDPGYLPKYLAEHRAVSTASVRAFAERYLAPNARVVVHAVPGTPDLGPPVPMPLPRTAAAVSAASEGVNPDEAWRATRPPAAPLHALAVQPARSFTLANGLTVIYQVRPTAPLASASLVLRTGGDANPPDRPGLANFVVTMIGQGTTTRDALTIADDFAQFGAALDVSSTKDQTVVSTQALARNLGPVLNLVADVALHPTFPAAELERQRASRLADLVAARQDPVTVGASVAGLAIYGPMHPYGFIELGTPASVGRLTRDDVVNFWKRTFVPANGAVVVTSALDEAALRPLVEKAFGAWPSGAAPIIPAGEIHPAPARVIIVDAPHATETHLVVAGVGAARSTPDYAALEVMNAVLGGLFSSRINLNLREAHAYTYGAGSEFVYRKFPGPFWVTGSVDTPNTAPAVIEIFKELRRMRDTRMSPAELSMARDALVRALPDDFETGPSTVMALSRLFVYGLGLDYYVGLPGSLSAVTAESAQAAAQKYLDVDGMLVVAVGDRAAIEPKLRKLELGPIDTWLVQ